MTAGAAKLLLDVNPAKAWEPLKEFQVKYEAAITRLEKEQKAKGDLDALVLVKKEKESFRARKKLPKPSPLAELNTLQGIYHKGLEPIEEKRIASENVAFENYRSELQRIVTELTREGKVEEALKVRKTLSQVVHEAASPADSANTNEEIILGKTENYTTTPRITVTKKEDRYIITSPSKDGESLRSKRTFKTPFTLQARAMTNGKSLRLFYGQQGLIIFNLEIDPMQLRIVEPVVIKRNGIPDSKPLEPDRMYDLELRVTNSKIRVYADKRKRGEVRGDFSKAEGTIGIGPAFGSAVTVERLVGIQE